jgi:hypothetical protein
MPFLRKKKGSKSVSTEESNQTKDYSAPVISAEPSSSKSKFGRKKKSKAGAEQPLIETHPEGAVGANSIPSKALSIPPPQKNPPQSQRQSNATSSQTITTASTSNASTYQSNNSSVSALFEHKKTNALQQRQISHMKRVGSNTHSINGGGVSPASKESYGTRLSQQSFNQQNVSQTQPQQQQPQTDLFTGMPSGPPAAMPITRSGWSMVSNASTAMNSVQYIESLNDLPGSPGIRGRVSFVLHIYYFYMASLTNC